MLLEMIFITEALGTARRKDWTRPRGGRWNGWKTTRPNEGCFGRGPDGPCVWFKLDVTVKCQVELVYLLNLCLLLINLQVFLLLGCPQSWDQETYQLIGRLDQSSAVLYITHKIHVRYIYLHEWLICMVNVGIPYMDPMGNLKWFY